MSFDHDYGGAGSCKHAPTGLGTEPKGCPRAVNGMKSIRPRSQREDLTDVAENWRGRAIVTASGLLLRCRHGCYRWRGHPRQFQRLTDRPSRGGRKQDESYRGEDQLHIEPKGSLTDVRQAKVQLVW